MKVEQLYEYPVKGMLGNSLSCASVNKRGLAMDRRWMLADDNGKFFSQRQLPALTQFIPSFQNELTIHHMPTGEKMNIKLEEFTNQQEVEVWEQRFLAHGTQYDINRWLSDKLEESVHLYYMEEHDLRPVKSAADSMVSFADAYPVLLTTQASLEDLNSKLTSPVTMDRFRPNIVVDGKEPFAEDDWQQIKIGEIIYTNAKLCARCHVININQRSGLAGKEPLRTLSTYRKAGNNVNFGINLIPENAGIIHEQDEVVVLS